MRRRSFLKLLREDKTPAWIAFATTRESQVRIYRRLADGSGSPEEFHAVEHNTHVSHGVRKIVQRLREGAGTCGRRS